MQVFRFRHSLTILLALLAGAALRIYFIHAFRQIQGDSLLYGAIADNWLSQGIYGFSARGPSPDISPTLIRLPGYPAFLALCFRIFGVDNYRAVLYLQAAIDLSTCLLIAAFVRRLCSVRAAIIALWLAALCPFTANYVATPLTETLSIFCVAAGFYAFLRLLERPGWLRVLSVAFVWSYCALLRPDGALLAVVLFFALIGYGRHSLGLARALRVAFACAFLSLLPFAAWTIRNWRTFHVFQPLAPRSAADPGEFTAPGFERWASTWLADFASTYEVYWNMPGAEADVAVLPSRAFDTPAQYEQTRRLFAQYNLRKSITPEIDAGFNRLASQRIRAHPLRSAVVLPLCAWRICGFVPGLKCSTSRLRWWQYSRHRAETRFAAAYGALNLAYLVAALVGAFYWPRYTGAMLAYIILRSLLLLTVTAPEPRYTLECFPILVALAARALEVWWGFCRRCLSVSGYRYNKTSTVPLHLGCNLDSCRKD